MKKSLILIFLAISICLSAQQPKVKNEPNHDDKPIHFGFTLGTNFMDYHIEHSEYAQQNNAYIGLERIQPGVNIQAVVNIRIAEYFDFRTLPGISFGDRVLTFYELKSADEGWLPYDDDNTQYRKTSSFIEMPLLIKYKAKRVNNFSPYLISGVNFRYDLAVKESYQKEQWFMMKDFDYYWEIGAGFDFYTTYFKFGLEFKYGLGMRNLIDRVDKDDGAPSADYEFYTNSFDMLKSQIFIISFHFE